MIILKILLLVIILNLIGNLLYIKFGYFKFLYHDKFGQHVPTDEEWVPNMSTTFHSHCKYCGKEIIQDSQGNWF